jgi:N-acetyl sugar amidotransferase
VSGGKDSTWQVVTALKYGLRPICVTWKSPARSELGQKNLSNLISLGVDHIDFTVNPKVERRFVRKAFEKLGSPAIPMHMAIHAVALQTALRFRCPLVIYGENSADEYGSVDDTARGKILNHNWLRRYGVTGGTTASDWIDEDLDSDALRPYVWPTDHQLHAAGVMPIFLGHFLGWDPLKSYQVASANGFEAASKPQVGLYRFADIDDSFIISIHHYMKWFKFGFTRTWDNIALEIRAGRLSREKGLDLLMSLGDEYPDKEIREFCNYVGYSDADFVNVVDKFRNPNIWYQDESGTWVIRDFLFQNWKW